MKKFNKSNLEFSQTRNTFYSITKRFLEEVHKGEIVKL